jgi:uncharacterized membrane protein
VTRPEQLTARADMTYGTGAMVSGVLAALLVLRLGEWRAMTAVLIVLIGCDVMLAASSPATVPVFHALVAVAPAVRRVLPISAAESA